MEALMVEYKLSSPYYEPILNRLRENDILHNSINQFAVFCSAYSENERKCIFQNFFLKKSPKVTISHSVLQEAALLSVQQHRLFY